jgi:hypothetical protein
MLLQAVFIYLGCLWYISPFFSDLPTLAKALPVFLGLFWGIFVVQGPTALIEKNIFTVYAAVGFIYSVVVAVLIKSDWALFMQVNMLFVGLLAYYIATPLTMQPYAILWIIAIVAVPSAIINNIIQGHSFANVVGALAGTRSTFTMVGATHHVMGLLGSLSLLSAWATWKDNSLVQDKRKIMTFICAVVGTTLLITSGARSYILAVVVAVAATLLFSGNLRKLFYLALVLPIVLVCTLYATGLMASRDSVLGSLLQFRGSGQETDATSGRSDLWDFHMHLFSRSPAVGHTLLDMQMLPVIGPGGVRLSVLRTDGIEASASTESFYDYFLARDGLTSIVTFSFFYALYAVAVWRRDIVFFSCMVFWFVATFGAPLLRISYSVENFLMALVVTQCYRRSAGKPSIAVGSCQ